MLQWFTNKGTVVKAGISSTYQWEGASSNLPSCTDLCQEQESAAHQAQGRQHDSRVLHKSYGGNQKSIPNEDHCLQKGIVLSAEHLLGRLNVGADQESRAKGDSSNWRLNPTVFQSLMSQVGPCQVDLFASRLNAQLESYMSWKPDPGSIATDALSQPWTNLKGYVCLSPFLPDRQVSVKNTA